jgi:hypothetical protein
MQKSYITLQKLHYKMYFNAKKLRGLVPETDVAADEGRTYDDLDDGPEGPSTLDG